MQLGKRINVMVLGRFVVFSTLIEGLTMQNIKHKVAKRLQVPVTFFDDYKFYLSDFTLVDDIEYLKACKDSDFLLYFFVNINIILFVIIFISY